MRSAPLRSVRLRSPVPATLTVPVAVKRIANSVSDIAPSVPLRTIVAGVVTAVVVLVAVTAAPPSAAAADAPSVSIESSSATPTTPGNGTGNAMFPSSGAEIVELYPNPTTEGNRGEYLVVRLPASANWSLSDGYHETPIPPNVSGLVVLSMHPETTSDLFGDESVDRTHRAAEIHALTGYFPLSASGDRIELRRNGTTVDVVDYDRVREGYRWRADWAEWRPRGYDPRTSARTDDSTVTPFVLPDSPGVPIEPLRAADDRLLLAGYTLESSRVADLLVDAAERGVAVRVLLEGSPVGGFSVRSARLADRLVAAGVEVRVLDGNPDRFRFHHAKYAVADDRAVVLTENWKASGTGGRTNRGWGVVTRGSAPVNASPNATESTTAGDLADLFREDATAPDARTWAAFRTATTFHESGTANETYPTRFAPPASTVADVELLTAPGNAADRTVARIDDADDRVLAIVPRTGGPDNRIVRALRRAADRGVDVHLLLSGAWYDREENRRLVETLADEPIDVAVAEPRGRYGKVHAKGVVVDDTAIVGSLNWNDGAATENREVLLAIEDESVASFYARTYAADWRGGGVHLPVGLLGGLGVAIAGAGAVARREVAFV